jgi:hypothetical protein
MKLHVLTAVTRPENLPVLAESLAAACYGPDFELCWHIRYDLSCAHVGGHQLKNDMLDGIQDGWVWMLDDDTVTHPDLFVTLADTVEADPAVAALVVSQLRPEGRVLHAAPENVVMGGIDIGQAVIRRDVIGDHRQQEIQGGDGHFLEAVLRQRDDVVYLDETLSFHNALERAPVAAERST